MVLSRTQRNSYNNVHILEKSCFCKKAKNNKQTIILHENNEKRLLLLLLLFFLGGMCYADLSWQDSVTYHLKIKCPFPYHFHIISHQKSGYGYTSWIQTWNGKLTDELGVMLPVNCNKHLGFLSLGYIL